MKKHLLCLTFLTFLISCTNNTVKFEVINRTDHEVQDFIIVPSGDGNLDYHSIKPNKSLDYRLDLDGLPEDEGSYTLSFQKNGKIMQEQFGHYSNGIPNVGTMRIEILPNTIRITPVSE